MTDNINYIYEMLIKIYPTTTIAKYQNYTANHQKQSGNPISKSKSKSKMIIELFVLTRLQLTLNYLQIYEHSIFVIKWTIMWYIMIAILSQICEYNMELLLIIMDHDNINNSFKFQSHLSIRYQGILMILKDLPMNFRAIYNIQLNVKQFTPGNIIHATYGKLS